MGGRSQEQTEQTFHWSLPPHAWRGGKLAPYHHNVGLLLTGDRHRLKEEEDRRCCMHVADTAVTWSACHQLRCWSVCDTRCFWWLCCPRISKRSWTENIAEVKKREQNCVIAPFSAVFGLSATGIWCGNHWLQTMDGFKTEKWDCLAGRQWFRLSSFPPEHTAQVRVWDFQGIPLVFGDREGFRNEETCVRVD